ncbi:hypothetical protein GIY56_04050 [Paracoccus sp. YIM 132242]|uniref:ABC transporter substrate-binding protein n=1 Tax=Paracoccus lichenicola TaxID=2665644 RepID=A0A6L6HLT3_9RHOB|nr:DVUA0089 family protein [Paracoccus lichenicola]MTD99458.1 hypothetical protein [Paracoccus lichenicola]
MPYRLSILASLALAAAPVLAQEAPRICGAAQVEWLAGDEAGQDIATIQAALSASVQVAGSQPTVLAFRTSANSQTLRVEASADNGDPAISLLTEDGDLIAENDDTPVSLNAMLETTVGPGIYCVALRSVGDGDMAATVQVSRLEQDPLLHEEGTDTGGEIAACAPDTPAAPLAEGAIDERLAQGPVSTTQDGRQVGYYRFTLSGATPVTLRASSPTLDPHLKLFDAQGTLIGENDDAEGLNARLDFVSSLAAGDYCIGAAALTSEAGELTVSAQRLDPQAFLRNAYRKGELNPPADGSYPVQAVDLARQKQTVVLHDGAAQWLGFDLDQPTVVIVSAYGSLVGADPRLVLFAASGALEAENDDVDGGTDARVGPVLLEPGRYHLGVVDVNRNDGTRGPIRPIGLMFERFLRAP